MAHLLIFDSSATVDADGTAVSGNDSAGISYDGGGALGSTTRYTKPVRVYGAPDGDIMKVGFEFSVVSASAFNITWYMEFFNDAPVEYPLPRARRAQPILNISPSAGWCREVTEALPDASAGGINHYAVTRTAYSLGGTTGTPISYHFPMIVHGLFVRLAITAAAAPAGARLLVFANVGGVAQENNYEALTVPWTGA